MIEAFAILGLVYALAAWSAAARVAAREPGPATVPQLLIVLAAPVALLILIARLALAGGGEGLGPGE